MIIGYLDPWGQGIYRGLNNYQYYVGVPCDNYSRMGPILPDVL